MSRFRIIALTALALLPALMLLYASGRGLLDGWLVRHTSDGMPNDVLLLAAIFAASTLSVMSTIWLARRGRSMSRRQRIVLAAPALLPALMNIVVLGTVLSRPLIIALKLKKASLSFAMAFLVTTLIVMLLSSISTIYPAWRSERKQSLDSVF
jgi:hypothetical protein